MAKKARSRGAPSEEEGLGGPTPGVFTEGTDTSDIVDNYFPELRLADKEQVLVRFLVADRDNPMRQP